MVNQLQIDIKTEGVFNKVYVRHIDNTHREQIYFGGSSSGKSVFLSDRTVLDVLRGRNYLICRKTGNTLRKSTFNEIKKSIYKFKLQDYFSINKSEMVITCELTGSQILFAGLDDVEKVKSITPAKGVITDIWVEEATEAELDDIKQLKKRLRGRSKFKKRLTISFNPILKSHWIYTEYFKGLWNEAENYAETENLSILKTTYKDNEFLEPEDCAALENEKDRYWYEVYTLGNWGILGHIIFKNWKIEKFDPDSFDRYHNGVDWGFSSDPFAFVRLHLNMNQRKLYVCDTIYQKNLLNKDSAKMVKEKIGIEIVKCDSAEPKSVAEWQQLGLNAFGAKKGKGSIEYGIKFLQSLEIIIHPRCQDYVNEIQTYQYKEDKDGNAMPVPVDKDNHCFIGSTLVETDNGVKRIDKITIDDKILTPIGYKPLINCGKTGTREIYRSLYSNGVELFSTASHKIYSKGRMIKIDSMRYGDIIDTCKKRNILYLMARSIILMADIISLLVDITENIKHYIWRCGRAITGLFLKTMQYTTRIIIKLITPLITLSVFVKRNIFRCMPNNTTKTTKSLLSRILIRLDHLQKNGTQAKRAENGIEITALKHGRGKGLTSSIHANNVENNSIHAQRKRSIVQMLVSRSIGVIQRLMTLKDAVLSATNHLRLTNIQRLKHVHFLVGENLYIKRDVYNLTIKDCPLFYANGILVSNCLDATRYALEDECYRMEAEPRVNMTIDGLKKKDVFDDDYEMWEDRLGVDYHGNNPYIKPENNNVNTGGVVAY